MKRQVDLFKPNDFTREWLMELKETFESGMIAQAGKVEEFEKEFGRVFKYQYPVALNSGTAALEMAYHLVGIDAGDKVLTTVLTCTATNIPLIHRWADIEFVDINPLTLTMDFDDFEKKVDKDTKAIVVVNLGGIYTDSRIFRKAKEMGIPVIVDAAQQLGVTEPAGDYVCYSFQAIKHFTTGDGGMICLRNRVDYERAKKLRWFGIDRDRRRRMNFEFSPSDREMCMDMEEPGFKTHMNDISATMGLVGLKHTTQSLEHRKRIAGMYLRELSGRLQCIVDGSYWLFCILLPDRDIKMEEITAKGVGNDLVHLRNDIFTPFGSERLNLPGMAEVENEYLYIPIHSKMTLSDAAYVADVVSGVI